MYPLRVRIPPQAHLVVSTAPSGAVVKSTSVLLIGVVVLLIGACADGETDVSKDSGPPKMLAVQHADAASIGEAEDGTRRLTLTGVSEQMILFSDRPERITVSEATESFMETWSLGRDSFEDDPPNATLVVEELDAGQHFVIAELTDPEYDPDTDTLTYVVIIEADTDVDLPSDFGEVTLVIDENCCFTACSC